ncbi:MAG: WbuC family cupin fold metalloprotein [Bryobacterales bacterium]|nr:WbuC family cupin fold metalloprotein [Bryobacterales bacterium]
MDRRPCVQTITEELIDAVVAQARQSARRRKNYNFHTGDQDNPHRFLNALLHGSYVRPHRHLTPPKAESFLVLRGHAAAFVFDDHGVVVSGHILGQGAYPGRRPSHVTDGSVARGIDLAPGLWHCVAALTPVAVCYEVKPGPWDPATDKEFPPWAPDEGSAEAVRYLATLLG